MSVEPTSLELMQEIASRVPDVEIRDEQIEALDALRVSEEPGEDGRSLIVMAPGLGKTTVMAAHARRLLLRDPNERGIVLNDNNDILAQARDRFRQIVGPEFTYGLFNGDDRDYSELSVLFASFQVMRDWHPAFLRDEFGFGMVDESHHGSARTYRPTIDYFDFENLSGFTATPDRMDIHDIRDIFGPERYSVPLEEAIAKRKLASVDYHVIVDEIAEQRRLVDAAGDEYSFSDLDQYIFAPEREEEIVRIINEQAESLPEVRRLIFCRSKEHADRYATYFPDAAAFHSSLSRKVRREILERFKTNELKTVVAVDAMNEGIDIPDANQVALLRYTGSKRIFLQQLGRGLRRTPTKKRVQVLDFVGNSDHLLEVDRLWRNVAALSREQYAADYGTFEIGLNTIEFSDSARNVLHILREVSNRVYNPGQTVPEGSVRLTAIARHYHMSVAATKAVMGNLQIQPGVFPTQAGSEILYVSEAEADRIGRSLIKLFRGK